MQLTHSDYNKLLRYYGVIPKGTLYDKKKIAHKIMANKLCKCIKKVQKTAKLKEPAAIAICNKSIFQKRNLKHYRFTCKKKKELLQQKGKKHILTKRKKMNLTKKTR